MKLIFAIISSEDSSRVCSSLAKAGIYFTKLATSGGFLSSGNTTLMIGIAAEKVDEVIELIASRCKKRKRMLASSSYETEAMASHTVEVTMGGATIFVTDVEKYEKM